MTAVRVEASAVVGRQGELAALARAVDAAAAGTVQVVAIGGAAGIGKSRLAAEGLALARTRGFTMLRAAAGALEQDLSYAPVVQALRPLLEAAAPPRRQSLTGGLPDLARLFDGLELPAPQPLGDPGLERTRLFEAVRRLLERAAAHAPVAILLDDVHWADPATLALLAYLTLIFQPGPPGVSLASGRQGAAAVWVVRGDEACAAPRPFRAWRVMPNAGGERRR